VRCFSILFGIETFTILKPSPRGGIINVDRSTLQKWILRKNVLVLSLDHATHVGTNLKRPRTGSVESFCYVLTVNCKNAFIGQVQFTT
jgi:hypothetical protein